MEPLFPPDPDELCIHVRDYEVRAFRLSPDRMLMRGAVRDRKPPGLYIPGDPDQLVLHHMIVDMEVTFPEMVIDKVSVVFRSHPEPECPNIAPAFDQLVGVSVSRGFNRRLRDLVGGPLGCTHVLALLTAMGPVVVQCIWSMRAAAAADGSPMPERHQMTDAEIEESVRYNRNSCHVWADEGPAMVRVRNRVGAKPPIPIVRRLEELGLDEKTWRPPLD